MLKQITKYLKVPHPFGNKGVFEMDVGKKWVVVVFLVVSLFLIVACSKEDQPQAPPVTGEAVFQASTINVIVKTENGTLVNGAQVFLNGKFKGLTAKHGTSKGSKKLVLEGKNNVILVRMERLKDSEPTTVSASYRGEQTITFVLEPRKTGYLIFVRDNEEPLPKAIVSLHDGVTVTKEYLTDDEGIAAIGEVKDGNYTITVQKRGFLPKTISENINYTEDGNVTSTLIVLPRLPYFGVTVTDSTGEPLENAEVTLYRELEYNTPGSPPLDVRYTLRKGSVDFTGVQLGESYVVIVKKEGFRAQTITRLLEKTSDQLVAITLEESNS